MERNIYKNPPVREVNCEIRFDRLKNWDATIPGLMFEKLKSDFPKKEQVQNIEAEIGPGPDGFRHNLRLLESLLIKTENENASVNISPYRLLITHFNPYTSWEHFLQFIDRVFSVYCEINNPEHIERINLRYNNEIMLPNKTLELKEFFNFYPYLGGNLSQKHFDSFIAGIQIPFDEGKNNLKLQLANIGNTLVLDLDYFVTDTKYILIENIFSWLDIAHQRIIEVFEGTITNQLRKYFGEGDRY